MQESIIKKGGLEHALKQTPNDLTPEDWEWLVKEHFSSPSFIVSLIIFSQSL